MSSDIDAPPRAVAATTDAILGAPLTVASGVTLPNRLVKAAQGCAGRG